MSDYAVVVDGIRAGPKDTHTGEYAGEVALTIISPSFKYQMKFPFQRVKTLDEAVTSALGELDYWLRGVEHVVQQTLREK